MRRLIAIVAVAGVSFSIYLATSPQGSRRVAVCPVRIDDDCRAEYRAAGINVSRYERLRFPVDRVALPDGGVEYAMPLAMTKTARCIEVLNWSDCTINTAASDPVVAGLWDAGLPVRLAPQRKCVRANYDAGLLCPMNGGGGGDRNVYLRTKAVNPAQCEPVECVVNAGENPEENL